MWSRNHATHYQDAKAADSKEEITAIWALTKQLGEYEQALASPTAPAHMKPIWADKILQIKKIIEDLRNEKVQDSDSNESQDTNKPTPTNKSVL